MAMASRVLAPKRLFDRQLNRSSAPTRQLRDVHRNPARLILREQLGPCLFLEVDVSKRLSIVIAHDEAGNNWPNRTTRQR